MSKPTTIDELFLPHTPYETYMVGGFPVDVKREDIFCHESIAPLAKMRGVNIVMHRLKEQNCPVVGVYDFKVSRAGVGIAAMSNLLKMACLECYPHYKDYDISGQLPLQQRKCLEWGAMIYPVPAAQIQINYNMAKKRVESLGGYMFPKGIILDETIESVASEIDYDRERLATYDNIIICAGSGTIITGILTGMLRNNLTAKVSAVCCTDSTIHCKRLHQFLASLSPEQKAKINLEILPATYTYYTEDNIECPFPSHPNYDKKAWRWYMENLHGKTNKPVLFWNVGA